MPRRAQFGRLPRAAPNYQSQIVAMAREMEDERRQLIMDAWKNGGIFEGKKATDERVLAFWKAQEKGLDKDDPLYEMYKNQVLQLQYGIEQSKADLAHVQGKLSDAGYAAFFIRWAHKVPRNSEFWRTLQKDAAQLMERAKRSSAAASKQRKVEAFNAYVANVQKKDTAIGDALVEAVNQMSQDTKLPLAGNGEQLLKMVSDDVQNNPGKYHVLLDAIAKGDKNWDGRITEGYYAHHVDLAEKGYGKIADRANHDGYASVYAQAAANQAGMVRAAQTVDVWPVAKAYDTAYAAYAKVVNDPNASSIDKQLAGKTFSAAVAQMADSKDIDAALIPMLKADAARAVGEDGGDAPSFGESVLGHSGVTPEMAGAAAYYNQQEELKAANPGMYTYAPTDAKGQFDPSGSGPVGIVAVSSIPPDAVLVPTTTNSGKAVMVAVAPHDILAKDPNNPSAAGVSVGKVVTFGQGSGKVMLYGYTDDKGSTHWSVDSPIAEGLQSAPDKDGNLVVTTSGQTGLTSDYIASVDEKYGTDIAAQLKAAQGAGLTKVSSDHIEYNKAGQQIGKTTVTYADGKMSVTHTDTRYDQATKKVVDGASTTQQLGLTPDQQAGTAIAPSRKAAGDIPGVTFNSPVAAAVAAAHTNMSGDQVTQLAQDPVFQHAFLTETMQTLQTSNPTDPRIAAAWHATTALAQPGSDSNMMIDRGTPVAAADRSDLTYPSAQPKTPDNSGNLEITFAGQTLKVPNVPAYLGGQSIQPSSANDFLTLSAAATSLGGNMPATGALLGAAAGLPPTGPSSAPTITPLAKPTTVDAKPTQLGASPSLTKPTPLPSPTQKGASGFQVRT